MTVLRHGETAGREVSKRILAAVADETALALISSTDCAHLSTIRVGAAQWYYDKDSAAAASAGSVVEPSDAVGRFLIDNPLGDVPAARLVTSGNGLTGGGDLSADRTLAVGAGAGITVAADSVAVTFGLVGEMAAAGVAAANAVGTTDKSARVDHVHVHGAQTAGTDHAAVIAAGASGFMTGEDKTKLDLYPAISGLTTGQVPRATGAATVAFGALDLANASAVTGALPGANMAAATASLAGSMSAAHQVLVEGRRAGLGHDVRGIVTANVADLGVFTVAGNDGLTYAEGERVGLVGQSTPAQSGIYIVGVVDTGVAPLTRAADWAAAAVLPAGSELHATSGTLWSNSVWFATEAGAITVATTDPAFYPRKQSGTTSAMAGAPGTVNVAGVWLLSTTKSHVAYSVNTAGGTRGFLAAPVAARTSGAGSGEFDVDSDANETSTIDWAVYN